MQSIAHAVAWESVLKSNILTNIKEICEDFDINLQFENLPINCNGIEHYNIIKDKTNLITWHCPYVDDIYLKNGKNIIYIEKCLIDPDNRLFFDSNGYGIYSEIVTHKYNKKIYSKEDKETVRSVLHRYGYKEANNNNRILIILKNNLVQDFNFLKICQEYLPKNANVTVYTNDNTFELINEKFNYKANGWNISSLEEANQSLKYGGIVVTNSVERVYQGLFMKMRVASFVEGFHSNTNAVLNCKRRPFLVKNIFDYYYDENAVDNLLCSIYFNSLQKDLTKDQIIRNHHFANWIKRIIR